MNEFFAMICILLVITLIVVVGGKLVLNWLELQVKEIELKIQNAELKLERERTAQEKERTRQALIEPVADRAWAVTLLPWGPAIILLLLLVPAGMYALGTTHPEWFEWTERDEAIYQAQRRDREAHRQAREAAEWQEYAEHHRPA